MGVYRLTDMLAQGLGLGKNNPPKPAKPEREIQDYPLFDQFIAREPTGYNSQSVRDFNELKNDTELYYNTYKDKEKGNDPDTIKFYNEHKKDIEIYQILDAYEKGVKKYRISGMKDIRKDMQSIFNSKDMDSSEKREKLKQLEKQMTNLARQALVQIYDKSKNMDKENNKKRRV